MTKTTKKTAVNTATQPTTTAEKITAENVQSLGERFAIKALKTYYQKSGMPFVYSLYCGLIADITENKKTDAPLSDGYDVAQTACAVLCAYIGKRLDDTSADGQTDKNGNPITIKTAVFRAVSKYVNGERQREYKRAYIDDLDENGNALIYEIPAFWDMPTATDYKTVTAKIAEMGLSMNEKKFLTYRLRGYSLEKIAPIMGVKRDTLNAYRKRLKDKAQKIGLTANV